MHLLMAAMTLDPPSLAYASLPSAKAGGEVTKQVNLKNMAYSFAVGSKATIMPGVGGGIGGGDASGRVLTTVPFRWTSGASDVCSPSL